MAKIPQYDPRIKDPELEGWLIDMRNILNNGRYTPSIVTSIPSASGVLVSQTPFASGAVTDPDDQTNQAVQPGSMDVVGQ